MAIQLRKFKYTDSGLMNRAFRIRENVFIREQNVPEELEKDSFDREAIHYILFDDDKAIATARRRTTDKGIKLERFAVLSEYRNRGVGSEILSFVLEDLKSEDATIYLNSQEKAVPFYERYGFGKSGEPFMEAGIRHFLMYYKA